MMDLCAGALKHLGAVAVAAEGGRSGARRRRYRAPAPARIGPVPPAYAAADLGVERGLEWVAFHQDIREIVTPSQFSIVNSVRVYLRRALRALGRREALLALPASSSSG